MKAAPLLAEKGFRQMKMQLALPGDTSPAREVERARLVREAIGPDIDLMCDINQRWSVNQAIDIGRRLEDVHFFWLEDVTAHDDFQVSRASPMRWRHPWPAASTCTASRRFATCSRRARSTS